LAQRGPQHGPQGLKWLNSYNSAADYPISLKFSAVTHTKVSEALRAAKLESELEFRRQEAFFRIPFWGHISAANQNIFTKVGVCAGKGVPQRVEWTKYACLKNPRWRPSPVS